MIHKKFKSKKKQKEISDMVLENWNKVNERAILERKWERLYRLYRGMDARGSYYGRANLDWAAAFQAVEILVPRIHNVLFPRRKWFDIVGVEQSDEKQAQIMSAYLRQKFERDVHFRKKMISSIRACAIYGTMIGKTPYRKESKTIPIKTRKTVGNLYGLFQPDFSEKEMITFDSIDLELVDIFDFYPADDFIDNIEDQPWVIHKTIEYIDTLYKKEYDPETGEGSYENLDKIQKDGKDKNLSRRGTENDYQKARKTQMGLRSRDYNAVVESIDFIEYQGVHEEEDIVAVVAMDGHTNPLVSAEPLNTPDGKKTFIMGKWVEVPGEFWGLSVLERIEKSIYELNDRVNQTMDVTSQIVNPIWLNTDADIPEGILRIQPNRIIATSTKDGLTAIRPPVEVLTPAYNAIQSLSTNIQDSTGATRFLGGSAQVPELQRTATGILSIIKEANARLNLTIQGIEDNWVIPFLRKSYKYAQFYAERKEVVRIVGKQGIEYQQVDPATILGDYDFRPLGSQSVGSEEVMTQQMLNYLNIIATIPNVMQQFDVMKLVSKIGEKMLGLDDMDELIMVNNREQEETEKAISENKAVMRGIPPVITANDNHALHKEVHEGWFMAEQAQEFPPQIHQMLQTHALDHDKYLKGSGMQPMYNQGNTGSGGVPPQSQPSPTNEQDVTNQMSQPSQAGQI